MLGRGPGLLSFRSGRVACGCILTGSLWCLLCKRRPRLFPLYTDPVVRCVFTSAATALRLFPRGRTPTGEVGAPTRNAPRRVSAVSLRVSEALAVLALQRALWSHVRLHRHSQAAVFGDWSHLGHLRPWRHWNNEVGGGGRADEVRVVRWPLFIPNSAGRLVLPLDSLRSWLNEQAWLALTL